MGYQLLGPVLVLTVGHMWADCGLPTQSRKKPIVGLQYAHSFLFAGEKQLLTNLL